MGVGGSLVLLEKFHPQEIIIIIIIIIIKNFKFKEQKMK
jgi:hypothetical protein